MLETIFELRKLGRDYIKEIKSEAKILKPFKTYEIVLQFSLLDSLIQDEEDGKIIDELKEAFRVLKDEFDKFNDIEYIMSHSDCILFNFQIIGSNSILHDFDNAKVLPSVHDIAEFFVSSALLNYRGEVTNLKLPIFLSAHDRVGVVLAEKISKCLTTSEQKMMPVCIEIIWLWTHMLSVIKEDYKIRDIKPVVKSILSRSINKELVSIFGSDN